MGCGAYKSVKHNIKAKDEEHKIGCRLPLSSKARIEIRGKKLFTIQELGASQELSLIRSLQIDP